MPAGPATQVNLANWFRKIRQPIGDFGRIPRHAHTTTFQASVLLKICTTSKPNSPNIYTAYIYIYIYMYSPISHLEANLFPISDSSTATGACFDAAKQRHQAPGREENHADLTPILPCLQRARAHIHTLWGIGW